MVIGRRVLLAGVIVGLFVSGTGVAEAAIIGSGLSPRAAASDGANTVLFTNFVPMPGYGFANAAAIWYQDQASTLTFHMYQLRPTGTPDQYTILYDSGVIAPSGTSGSVSILPFPNGPTQVQAGDIFAHYGYGIPFSAYGSILQQGDGGINAVPIFYSSPSAPVVGNSITLSTTQGSPGFPIYPSLIRDYASAVNIVPEPSALAMLAGAGGLGLLGVLWRRRGR